MSFCYQKDFGTLIIIIRQESPSTYGPNQNHLNAIEFGVAYVVSRKNTTLNTLLCFADFSFLTSMHVEKFHAKEKKRLNKGIKRGKCKRLDHGRIYMNNVTILITTTLTLSLYMCANFTSFDIALNLEEKDEY